MGFNLSKNTNLSFSLRDATFLKIVFEAIIWFDKVWVVGAALQRRPQCSVLTRGLCSPFYLRTQSNTATLALRATQCNQATSLSAYWKPFMFDQVQDCAPVRSIESYHCFWIGLKPSHTHTQSEYEEWYCSAFLFFSMGHFEREQPFPKSEGYLDNCLLKTQELREWAGSRAETVMVGVEFRGILTFTTSSTTGSPVIDYWGLMTNIWKCNVHCISLQFMAVGFLKCGYLLYLFKSNNQFQHQYNFRLFSIINS